MAFSLTTGMTSLSGQVPGNNPDSVFSLLEGRWELYRVCGGFNGICSDPDQDRIETYIFDRQELSGDSIYYAYFVNRTYISRGWAKIYYDETVQGDSCWYLLTDNYPFLNKVLRFSMYCNEYKTYCDMSLNTNGYDTYTYIFNRKMPWEFSSGEYFICNEDSIRLAGTWVREEGLYFDILSAKNGSDSLLKIILNHYEFEVGTGDTTICQGDSVLIGGSWEKEEGNYIDRIEYLHGCDSLVNIQIFHHQSYTTNRDTTICEGDSILIDGLWRKIAGYYTENYPDGNGCDSLIMISLELSDCLTGNVPVDAHAFRYYPNPVHDMLHIETGDSGESSIYIYNLTGQLNYFSRSGDSSLIRLDLSGLPTGMYFIRVCHGNRTEVIKISRE